MGELTKGAGAGSMKMVMIAGVEEGVWKEDNGDGGRRKEP